ncbi:MAG: hypothetical protein A3G33_10935 [Omnitrophica bacterium RIFCSPLOWO2_12_FULL_44_17]|uniref:Lipoyl-binding domain-containing protein n=1 Tax=Candidatus Danuiimicrobium aquiferis TaxID=1801832 RepID=A0A1G1KST1_9BACT|nr:MAG: hypothetical protein A3B72_01115 [Omnitrophica bacterium RIFCSPHIGHO2_02_FULL_45_28]OGW88805.1 MAG: hypothetical protein A3E74_04480 [Omnitrophica bacterium RIFCSPHIGHO2_12_FULL_44_12]OGW96013.1 MAG: hypothetical protein A3G33_10935 [Omnitrophica bacterium RIFCSPLOWO2_12_FULL_44_17]OGX03067.1 MAG: hypothetical protein A3J12_08560 [Omnitrophica bacterium RIFCSPLOWO2_02_FULL_44_11]
MAKVVLEELNGDIEEGIVETWFFQEGDQIAEGDDLVRIETDEGTHTVTSPFSGHLNEIYFTEGEEVGLGDVLCEIEDDEE